MPYLPPSVLWPNSRSATVCLVTIVVMWAAMIGSKIAVGPTSLDTLWRLLLCMKSFAIGGLMMAFILSRVIAKQQRARVASR